MKQKPIYIIAEAGVNHNGQLKIAYDLIDIAADAGANAVKFQTFNASTLTSSSVPKAEYQKKFTGKSESQMEMLKKLELPYEWHQDLKNRAEDRGLDFLSTAFDIDSHNFLMGLGIQKIKIPSGELTNGPLIWKFAKSKKELILSTGMANIDEVEDALAIIAHSLNSNSPPKDMDEVKKIWDNKSNRNSLKGFVTILHCTSQYPARLDQINLNAMISMRKRFELDVGYSDHSQGINVALASAAIGATIIEKHFTTSRKLSGPDHNASLEPKELELMIKEIRKIEIALGDGIKKPHPDEEAMKFSARKQIIASKDIAKNALLSIENLSTSRAGSGMSPNEIWSLIGKKSKNSYNAGEIINE